ncbi:A-factor-binding protein [Serratia proteamaculans]|uniref:TetR/AcrR family transcriptional regulator n=1 Tax=Serratia proteamaculans TaxID=28151 RepID=UPI00217AE92C|nr:TetR/AcrR family transcriptional regulator [Serratia proteamaculans]CAI1196495.1 A-factor-binding protein [Serratia proteamaculans]CAI1966048.1 A-factor-binding protein [Serratia proteamaculans]CAI1974203.1 A-factor-binding protein [Serratia proteamaculans]CAI2000572.1 A-factor-binding protein [Serratia proteamaculans]CAI2500837.1 A-factor-binding protein [Serratia proteamaculans]
MKVRTNQRRDAIVEEAAALFQEMGYERASMNELAKRVGGSKATLYGYFPSKEELFTAVVRQYATQHLSEAATELINDNRDKETLEQTLIRFGEQMLLILTNDNSAMAVYRMVVAESGHSDIGTLFYEAGPRESVERLSVLMSAAMDRQELRLADPYLKATQFLSLLTAEIDMRVFQRELQPVGLSRIKEMVSNAVSMFLAGAAFRKSV